jgi:hypothetical protein
MTTTARGLGTSASSSPRTRRIRRRRRCLDGSPMTSSRSSSIVKALQAEREGRATGRAIGGKARVAGAQRNEQGRFVAGETLGVAGDAGVIAGSSNESSMDYPASPAKTSKAEPSRAEIPPPPTSGGKRSDETNPRARGTDPRRTGENPRANGTSPRQQREAEKRGPLAPIRPRTPDRELTPEETEALIAEHRAELEASEEVLKW